MSQHKLIESTPRNPSQNHSLRLAGLLFAVLLSVICFPDSVQADYVEGRVRVMRAEGPTVEVILPRKRVKGFVKEKPENGRNAKQVCAAI